MYCSKVSYIKIVYFDPICPSLPLFFLLPSVYRSGLPGLDIFFIFFFHFQCCGLKARASQLLDKHYLLWSLTVSQFILRGDLSCLG